MNKGILWSSFLLLSVSLLLLSQPSTGASAALAQSFETTIESNVFYLVQGESASSDASPSSDEFYALHIISFNLPYNQSRVYSYVPSDPVNLTVWTVFQGGGTVEHGWETSGPYEDSFYVVVPSSHVRTAVRNNTTDSASDFLAQGSQLVNLEYSSGALHLLPNETSGSYVSAPMSLPELVTIDSANLTFYGNSTENISSELSNDGGLSWISCTNGANAVFPSNGTSLLIRFLFDGNSTLGFDPLITKFVISASYLLPTSTFTVHISYSWHQEFDDGKTILNLTEPLPYSNHGSFLVMLNTFEDYTAQGTELDLIWDEDRAINTDTSRELYYNSTIVLGGSPVYTIEVSKVTSNAWALYVGIAAVVGLSVIGVVVIGRKKKSSAVSSKTAPLDEAQTPSSKESVTKDAERRKELIERRQELTAKLELLESGAGKPGRPEETEKEIADVRKELKSTRNELNRLSRKAKSASLAGLSAAPSETSESYESVLASLAKLDADFESGRLPESTYKTIRKEYVDKAAQLLASREAAGLGGEKVKLMEAIVSLEEEHERGEVADDVYRSLSASYRKELAEVMRKMDESGMTGE